MDDAARVRVADRVDDSAGHVHRAREGSGGLGEQLAEALAAEGADRDDDEAGLDRRGLHVGEVGVGQLEAGIGLFLDPRHEVFVRGELGVDDAKPDIAALAFGHGLDGVAALVPGAEGVHGQFVGDGVGADGLGGLPILGRGGRGIGDGGERMRRRRSAEDALLLLLELFASQESAVEKVGEIFELLGLAGHVWSSSPDRRRQPYRIAVRDPNTLRLRRRLCGGSGSPGEPPAARCAGPDRRRSGGPPGRGRCGLRRSRRWPARALT